MGGYPLASRISVLGTPSIFASLLASCRSSNSKGIEAPTLVGVGIPSEDEPMSYAGQALRTSIGKLINDDTFPAKSILVVDVYGRGNQTDDGESYKKDVFEELQLRSEVDDDGKRRVNIAYVDLSPIWTGVLTNNPGYKAFGYRQPRRVFEDAQLDCRYVQRPRAQFLLYGWISRFLHPHDHEGLRDVRSAVVWNRVSGR
jgi:hypothetical protein